VDEKQAHKTLADGCLKLMFHALKKDICKVRAPGFLATEVEGISVQKYLPSELQYACLYWVRHLLQSSAQLLESDIDKVYQFLRVHLLHWLEALGWMGRMSDEIQAILSLEAYVSVSLCLRFRML